MFEKLAYAAGPAAGQPQVNPLLSFAPFFLLLGVFYFLLIRPQQKKQKEMQTMIDALKKGDRVVTAGGILGTVTSLQDDYVVLKIGDNEQTKIEILKSSISGLRNK
ncbi:MAG: preprotein translocase subunit YajC [Candidatus Omnitrophica bacterium]|nr:preprotein translocase subunit YajC [Candidatus Omnitrophota bacterium]